MTTSRLAPASLGVLLLVLTVEMSLAEFAQLQGLSDKERHARFDLPEDCVPGITAMRSAAGSQRLIVLIDCKAEDADTSDLLPI
jgi:hypothetical protein